MTDNEYNERQTSHQADLQNNQIIKDGHTSLFNLSIITLSQVQFTKLLQNNYSSNMKCHKFFKNNQTW